ncbi:hypothetical protein VTN96DRAFT_74 [Rasamsonia emersonii]
MPKDESGAIRGQRTPPDQLRSLPAPAQAAPGFGALCIAQCSKALPIKATTRYQQPSGSFYGCIEHAVTGP